MWFYRVSTKYFGVIVGPYLVFAATCIAGLPKRNCEKRLANFLIGYNPLFRGQRSRRVLIDLVLVEKIVVRKPPLHVLLHSIIGFEVTRADSILIIRG